MERDVFLELIKKSDVTQGELKNIFEATKGFEDEGYKIPVFVELTKNPTFPQESMKDLLQEMLFSAYNENLNNEQELKIEENDLDKAYKAMKHVSSGGRQLTEDNKAVLKNTDQWTGLIEKICHYVWKVVTLGLGTTQKESRENFNGVIGSFTKKIENEKTKEIKSQGRNQ